MITSLSNGTEQEQAKSKKVLRYFFNVIDQDNN